MIGLILGLTGISCDDGHGPGPQPEYGMPYAKYVLDGTVVNADTEEPVEGIKVRFPSDAADGDSSSIAFSDENGDWAITRQIFPCGTSENGSIECDVSAQDVDGAENGGTYVEQEVDLNLTQTKQGSGTWDKGTFEQHDITIELSKEE